MMRKKCKKFHWCTSRGLNFIETVYDLFDNPSYFLWKHWSVGFNIFDLVTLILECGIFFLNINLQNNFSTVSAWVSYITRVFLLIRTFLGYCIFDTVILTLEFDLFIRIFNLAHKIWTMSARALIFRMTNNSDNTFPWVLGQHFFTMWPWPWSLIYFLKTLIWLITFQQRVLEFSYLTWEFLVIRSFCWYWTFWPRHLTIFLNEHWS